MEVICGARTPAPSKLLPVEKIPLYASESKLKVMSKCLQRQILTDGTSVHAKRPGEAAEESRLCQARRTYHAAPRTDILMDMYIPKLAQKYGDTALKRALM